MKTLPSEAIVISIPSLMPDASKLSSKSGSAAWFEFGTASTLMAQKHSTRILIIISPLLARSRRQYRSHSCP